MLFNARCALNGIHIHIHSPPFSCPAKISYFLYFHLHFSSSLANLLHEWISWEDWPKLKITEYIARFLSVVEWYLP